MKKVLFIFLFFFFISNLHAQWEYTFGGGGRERGYKMMETYDRGFAILGQTGPIGNEQIFFMKTDINGNILWNKIIGNSLYFNWSLFFDVTRDGGFILSGVTTQYDNMGAAFVLKLNECGEKQWCKIFGLPNDDDRADYVHQLPDNSYIVCTRYFGTPSPTIDRLGLMKLDSIGNILWMNDYSHYNNPDASSLILTNDSGFLLVGDCYVQNPTGDTSFYWLRTILIKVDSLGNEQWNIPYGIANYFYSRAGGAREFNDGSYLTLCTHKDSINLYGAWTYLFKTDANGAVIWARQIGDSAKAEWDLDILALNDSQSVILSSITDTFPSNTYNLKLLKIDTAGNILDSVTYGYSNQSPVGTLEKTRDGKILVCATKYLGGSNYDIHALKLNEHLQLDTMYNISLNYDSLCNMGITTGTISLDTMSYVGVEEVARDEGRFLVYPNPASNQFKVQSLKFKVESIEIYDVLGEKIFSLQNINTSEMSVDVSAFPSGIYFINVTDETGNKAVRKVVKL